MVKGAELAPPLSFFTAGVMLMRMEQQGILYVVATPIGNLEDITHRALRILTEADYVLCEDTRVTGKLLAHYGIKSVLKRYDAHTPEHVHTQILQDLASGKTIALVSDAGTPGISDPGVFLVAKAREAGIRIDAVPGPSSLTAAFSIAGIPGNQFMFLGFVPQKKGRRTFFRTIAESPVPAVFFESTHRILKTLESLQAVPKGITIAREITKMHEEVVSGNADEVLAYFLEHSDHQKGEFVVFVY